MINNLFNNKIKGSVSYTNIKFEGSTNLVCYRTLPFAFNLVATKKEISARDVRVFYTDENTPNGCSKLIEAIRDFAISTPETWTNAQNERVEGAKTLYIVYYDYQNVILSYDKEFLNILDIEEINPLSSKCIVSNDVSDLGLINLVNEFLNWIKLD